MDLTGWVYPIKYAKNHIWMNHQRHTLCNENLVVLRYMALLPALRVNVGMRELVSSK